MSHRCTGQFCPVCETRRLIRASLDEIDYSTPPEPEAPPASGPGIPTVTCETLQHRDLALEEAYDAYHGGEGYVEGGFDPYAETDGRTVGVYSAAGGYQSTDQMAADAREAAEEARRTAEHISSAPNYRRNR